MFSSNEQKLHWYSLCSKFTLLHVYSTFLSLIIECCFQYEKITLTACWCTGNTEFSGQNMFLIFIYNMLMVYFIANKLIEIFIASSWNLLKCILSDYIHVEDLTNIQVISIETSYAVTEIMCLCMLTFVL